MTKQSLPKPRAGASFLSAAARARLERIAPDALAELAAQPGAHAPSETHRAAREIAGLDTPPKPERERRPNKAHQRYQAQLGRGHKRYVESLRWQEARRAEFAQRPGAPDLFRVIPREVWELAARCMGSRRAAWYELCRCGNRAAVGAIRRAAFGGRRGWPSSYALRVIVLALCELKISQPTRGKRGRWAYNFDGVPIDALRWLLRDPHSGRVPSKSAMSGRHRSNGDVDNGQIGYLRALEAVRFHRRFQRERPTRWNPDRKPSCNTYWIIGHSAYLFGAALVETLQLVSEADQLEQPLSRGPPAARVS